MAGSCKIDGFDIADIGMLILRGGDNDLLAFPERKEPQKNDWFEHDGLDVDLSEPCFNAKTIKIKFYLKADTAAEFQSNLETFREILTGSDIYLLTTFAGDQVIAFDGSDILTKRNFNPGYRSLYIRDFEKTFALRYISCPQFNMRGGLLKLGTKSAELEVEFSDDSPLDMFDQEITLPAHAQPNDTFVYLNDIELKEFGITVKNIYNTALQISDVKPGLLQSNEKSTGVITDLSTEPHKQSKKITIECTMTAKSRETFYTNYNALFNNLVKTEALLLALPDEKEISCYYSNMSSFEKVKPLGNGAMVRFSLVFVELSTEDLWLLYTFADQQIITFDKKNIAGMRGFYADYFTFCAPEGFRPEDQPVNIIEEYNKCFDKNKRYIFSVSDTADRIAFNIDSGFVANHLYSYELDGIRHYQEIKNEIITNRTGTLNDGYYTEIPVQDTSAFPESGVVHIGRYWGYQEFIYTSKTPTSFIGPSQHIIYWNRGIKVVLTTKLKGTKRYMIYFSTALKISAGFAYACCGSAEFPVWWYLGKDCQRIGLGIYGTQARYIHYEDENTLWKDSGGEYYTLDSRNVTGILTIPKQLKILAYNLAEGNVYGHQFSNLHLITKIIIHKDVWVLGVDVFIGDDHVTDYYFYPVAAPTILLYGGVKVTVFSNYGAKLHIKPEATGYDVVPWTNTAIFSEIIRDL